jgi:hypothetical protein
LISSVLPTKSHNAGQHSPNQSSCPRFEVNPLVSVHPPLTTIPRATRDPPTRDGTSILETGNSRSRYVLEPPVELMKGSSLDREAEAEGSLLPAVNTNTAHLSLDAQRQRLPIYKHRQKLLWCVEKYRVVIVVGQTGCGKSTRELLFIHNVWMDELIDRDPTVPT